MVFSDEESKAAQEIAKTTGKSLEVVEGVVKFLGLFVGGAPSEIGEIVTAWTRYFKFKNILIIQDKVQKILRDRDIEGKTTLIPARLAIPLLEAATQESEDLLQNKWAALIANASDPGKAFNVRKVFISILADLEPLDTAVLDILPEPRTMSTRQHSDDSQPQILHGMVIFQIAEQLQTSAEEILLSLHNLIRLGCVGYHRNIGSDAYLHLGFGLPSVESESQYWSTELGHALRLACRA